MSVASLQLGWFSDDFKLLSRLKEIGEARRELGGAGGVGGAGRADALLQREMTDEPGS